MPNEYLNVEEFPGGILVGTPRGSTEKTLKIVLNKFLKGFPEKFLKELSKKLLKKLSSSMKPIRRVSTFTTAEL